VDVVRGEKMTVQFDITFHRLACEEVTVDLLDESGAHFTAIGHEVMVSAFVRGALLDSLFSITHAICRSVPWIKTEMCCGSWSKRDFPTLSSMLFPLFKGQDTVILVWMKSQQRSTRSWRSW
jgi:hypothetical protein